MGMLERIMGITRRLDADRYITRIFVLDQMIDLIDEYISNDEATKVIDLYQSWALGQGGNYNAFEKLFKDIISEAEDLPEMIKYRFRAYLDYLFPGPPPT